MLRHLGFHAPALRSVRPHSASICSVRLTLRFRRCERRATDLLSVNARRWRSHKSIGNVVICCVNSILLHRIAHQKLNAKRTELNGTVFPIIIRGFQFNAKNPIRNSDNGRTHKWMCECEIFNDWWWWPPRLLPESCMRKCQNLTDANRTTHCRRRRTQVYLQFIRSQLQCRAACVCVCISQYANWLDLFFRVHSKTV